MARKVPGYDAFVSYSHDQDRVLAEALQSELQRFARPWYRARALRIFRDETNLSASPGLWPAIERALEASSWFVLMASPGSAKSPWVKREIHWWLAHRNADRILLALTDGEIHWTGQDFDWDQTDAIPRQLSGVFTDEPFWIDLRKLRSATPLEAPHASAPPHLGDIVAEFAAPIHGRDKDTLAGEHIRYQRRTRRLVRAVIGSLSTLLLVVSITAYVANDQRNRAVTQARIATARQLAADSEALLSTNLDIAQLLAVEAYRTDNNPQTRSALFQAVTSSPALVRYLPAGGRVTAITGSADGTMAVAGTDGGKVTRWAVAGGPGTKVAQLHGTITAAAANRDGTVIAAADGSTAIVWTPTQGAQPIRMPLGTIAMAVSPSGRFVAVSSCGAACLSGQPAEVTLLDRQTGQTKRIVTDIRSFLAMPTDAELVNASADGSWERFSVPAMVRTAGPAAASTGVHQVAETISSNGEFFGYTNGGTTAAVWSTAKPVPPSGNPDLVALSHGSAPEAIAVSADGKRVAVADANAIYLSETAPGAPGRAAQLSFGGNGSTSAVQFLGDDNHLLSASGTSLTLWDLSQLTRISRQSSMTVPFACNACAAPTAEAQDLALSPERRIVVVDSNGTVHVEEFATRPVEKTIPGPVAANNGLIAATPDPTGSFVAETVYTGSTESLDLIDTNTGGTRTVGTGEVASAAFSGGRLLIRRTSGQFEVWNLAGTTLQRLIQQDPTYAVPTAPAVVGSLLVQERSDGTFTVTDLGTGDVLGSLTLPAATVGLKTGLAATADGRQLVSVTESDPSSDNRGLLVRWDLSVNAWIRAACTSSGHNLTSDEWRRYVGTAAPHDLICAR